MKLLWLAGAILLSILTEAQIRMDTTLSTDLLVDDILLGEGIIARNIRYTGGELGLGVFSDSSEALGMKEGIILSTGNVFFATGPNKSQYTSWVHQKLGDEDLSELSRGRTYDATILEFDFMAESEELSFDYVFASEEYSEYVGSKFNDVFGFWINLIGSESRVNVATLPDGKTPITINSINRDENREFYRDNDYINTTDPILWDTRKRKVINNKNWGKAPIPTPFNHQYDGFTTVLTARLAVIPNEWYHIKMAIADVSDAIFDSAVILKAESFRSTGETIFPLLPQVTVPGKISGIPLTDPRFHSPLLSPVTIPPLQDSSMYVNFAFDKYSLGAGQKEYLEKVIRAHSANHSLGIIIAGHTDSRGSESYNERLSKQRAETVYRFMIEHGVDADRLFKMNFGEQLPLTSNDTDMGRAQNRRVELIFCRVR